MLRTDPIGIFDSGVGGLTVVKSILEKLPDENLVYFGDTAHVPYGEKSRKQLLTYAEDIMEFMINKGCKAVVVACGTHSSITLPAIINNYELPLLGVVEVGARQAAAATRNGRIGVVATLVTDNSRAFTASIGRLDENLEVLEIACPQLVPLIEAGKLDGEELQTAIKEYFDPLLAWQADTVILGCTHYPFVAPAIKKYTGDKITLIDTAGETVNELNAILKVRGLDNDSGRPPRREFYVSGEDTSFYKVGEKLMGDVIDQVEKIDIRRKMGE